MANLVLRRLNWVIGLMAAQVLATGCDELSNGGDMPATTTATLRVIHLSPDAPAIDILAGPEARIVRGLAFPDATGNIEVPAGDAAIDIVPAGGAIETSVLRVGDLFLGAGRSYTAYAFNRLASLTAVVVADDPGETMIPGYMRVRVIHAATGAGKVDIWSLPADREGTLAYDNVELGHISPYIDLPIGAYELGIDVNDDARPELVFPLPSLAAGTVANIFVSATLAGEISLIALTQDGATALIEPKQEPIDPPPPVRAAFVRALHLSPDAPAVAIYANGAGTPAADGLAFGQGTGYVEIPSGAAAIDLAPAGTSLAGSVLRAELQLTADARYTAVAIGNLAELQLLALEDRLDDVPAGSIRVRAVHAAAGVGQVDLWNLPARGAPGPLYTDVDFGVAGDYLELPEGAYRIGLDANNDASPDFVFELPALPAGTVATIFAVRSSAGAVYLVAQLADGTLVEVQPKDLTPARVRVIHLSPDAPAVAVYANEIDSPVVQSLTFADGTRYLELPNGNYAFDVAPANTALAQSVLSVDSVDLMPERSYTVAAIDRLASIDALLLEDNFTAIPDGQIRIRAIHAAVGVGPVNILNVTHGVAALYENVPFGAAGAPLDVPAAAYRIGLDTDFDHLPELTFSLPHFAAGSVVNVFASNANGIVELIVQLADGTVVRVPHQ